MAEQVGKITHYYDKAGVAVVELSETLAIGDMITVQHGETSFNQTVQSMQLDHENVNEATAGTSVGLKVDQKVKPGATVLR